VIEAGVSPASLAFDDELSFAGSIEPLLPIGFRLAYAMLRSREDAEDAVQEAAMKAWHRRRTFRAGAEPRPWFLAIVANQCRMARRRKGWESLREATTAEAAATGPAEFEEADGLRRALARLSREDRLALVLRFYLDLPNEEVARTLNVSPAAARVRVHRALRRLRPAMEIEGLSDG